MSGRVRDKQRARVADAIRAGRYEVLSPEAIRAGDWVVRLTTILGKDVLWGEVAGGDMRGGWSWSDWVEVAMEDVPGGLVEVLKRCHDKRDRVRPVLEAYVGLRIGGIGLGGSTMPEASAAGVVGRYRDNFLDEKSENKRKGGAA